MIVIKSDQTVFVGWRYENPELDKFLEANGLSHEDAKKMTEPELIDRLGVIQLPKPHITTCILSSADKQIVAQATVRRHKADPYDKDKARRYSLAKVLRETYPGLENLEVRRAFWEAYINRGIKLPAEMRAIL